MNNSALRPDPQEPKERAEMLREREVELVKLIEATAALIGMSEWSTLKELVFDQMRERAERLLLSEAKKPKLEESELYRLQGRLEGITLCNLEERIVVWKAELTNVRKQLTLGDGAP